MTRLIDFEAAAGRSERLPLVKNFDELLDRMKNVLGVSELPKKVVVFCMDRFPGNLMRDRHDLKSALSQKGHDVVIASAGNFDHRLFSGFDRETFKSMTADDYKRKNTEALDRNIASYETDSNDNGEPISTEINLAEIANLKRLKGAFERNFDDTLIVFLATPSLLPQAANNLPFQFWQKGKLVTLVSSFAQRKSLDEGKIDVDKMAALHLVEWEDPKESPLVGEIRKETATQLGAMTAPLELVPLDLVRLMKERFFAGADVGIEAEALEGFDGWDVCGALNTYPDKRQKMDDLWRELDPSMKREIARLILLRTQPVKEEESPDYRDSFSRSPDNFFLAVFNLWRLDKDSVDTTFIDFANDSFSSYMKEKSRKMDIIYMVERILQKISVGAVEGSPFAKSYLAITECSVDEYLTGKIPDKLDIVLKTLEMAKATGNDVSVLEQRLACSKKA